MRASRATNELVVDLVNTGGQACVFLVAPNKYAGNALPEVRVADRSRSTIRLSLAATY